MIKRISYTLQQCPVCGRPLEVAAEHRGRRVTCTHCRGRFRADGADNHLNAMDHRVRRVLRRADRLLAMAGRPLRPATGVSSVHQDPEAARPDCSACPVITRQSTRAGSGQRTDPAAQGRKAPLFSTIVLVEQRDQVFARLAIRLASSGLRVLRARNATQAIGCYLREPTALLVVDADRPGESVWLLAAKLHLTHPGAGVWAYMHRSSAYDAAAAEFLGVEELIEYGHDPSRLTRELFARLGASLRYRPPRRESESHRSPA